MTRNAILKSVAGAAAAYAGYRLAMAYRRRFDFAGKVAVITGGSRGLGLNLARQLVQAGARVAICSRSEQDVSRAVGELAQYGQDVAWQVGDLTNADELARFIEHVRRTLGPVDVLINNAGVIQVGPAACMTIDDFEEALAIHLWAPLRAIEWVLPSMLARGSGRIVNIASIGGEISVPHLLPYCVSKFALVGLSQGLRSELANRGVYVTTVCPGLMRTGSHWHALFKGQHRQEAAWFSVSASAPLATISAESAARQILRACRWGRAQATLSLPAKAAVRLNSLAPELMADAFQLAARLLPAAGGIGTAAVEGSRSLSRWFPSAATALGDRAAARHNELNRVDALAPPTIHSFGAG